LITAAVLAVIAALSLVIYRANERDAVQSFATQQLGVARTVAVALETEIAALSGSLRLLNTLPSVQGLDLDFVPQRVNAAFQHEAVVVIQEVVRIDMDQRRYAWSTKGRVIASGEPVPSQSDAWDWFADRGNAGAVRIDRVWWMTSGADHLRILATPVWRVASSGEMPIPPNDFHGVLAFVVDVGQLVNAYARRAQLDRDGSSLVLDLGGKDSTIRVGLATRSDEVPNWTQEGSAARREATVIEHESVVAWTRLEAPLEEWTVAVHTPYAVAAESARGGGQRQLAIVLSLLIAVPVLGWLLVRRERRSEDEQRQLHLQLAQAQKMDAIGKLAGGIAHDFNNMLTAILGYASLILESVPPKSSVHEEATQIKRAAESAAALTQKLLAFSRRQVLQPQQISLRDLLDDLLPLLRRLLGAQIVLESNTEDDLWPIVADPVHVEQSIVNLAINARDAMPDGGRLQIAACNVPRGDRRAEQVVAPGDYVRLTVKDSGIGMDEATRGRMFEPFFTTKPTGKGTGLGLSTVYGIVKQSGGHITVESAPGSGTSIELLLPRAPAGSRVAAAPIVHERPVPGHETVLLVEDDGAVRELARATLDRHGYRLLCASSSEEALQLMEKFNGPIALLLTDVVMPGIQGPDLAVKIRLMRPGIRVLFMSGYAAETLTEEMLRDASHLQKPFSAAVLARTVRAVLDRR
jgi:signal transduction histidine kinase